MCHPGIDIRKITNKWMVNFRVAQSQWQEIKEEMTGCREADSVEEILMQAEQVTVDRAEAGRFEEYVSTQLHGQISLCYVFFFI